jgi:hypothetical protein
MFKFWNSICHINLFNIKLISILFDFPHWKTLVVIIYSISTSHFQSWLSANFEVKIHFITTTNIVNGKMDSNGTPSAGDLLNVQSSMRAMIYWRPIYVFYKWVISSKVPESHSRNMTCFKSILFQTMSKNMLHQKRYIEVLMFYVE